jgi:diguanylate cyclase (GGDEF)-like protein
MGRPVPARLAERSADPVLIALVGGAVGSVAAVLAEPAVVPAANVIKVAVWAAFAWLCWQVAARPQIAVAARRFWRTVGAGGVLFVAARVVELTAGLGRPSPPEHAVFAWSVLTAVAVALLGWAVLTYPVQVVGGDRARLRLDVATVMCAFVMAGWHLCLPAGSLPARTAQFGVTVLGCGTALVAIFGAVNLALSGCAPYVPAAGAVLGAGMLIGAWALFNTLTARFTDPQLFQAAQLASAFLFAIAARVQYLQMRTRPSGVTALRRPAYSRLPYLAVAASQVILVSELWSEGLTVSAWGMVFGVVVVATLVTIRQNLAFRDIARLQQQLRHEATHDPLTGLANRALLDEQAQRARREPSPPAEHSAVLLLDLDGFKAVNDELGHHVGDQLLVAVAQRLRGCARPGDTVARLGGDEFVVLLTDTATAGAERIARRILDTLPQPVHLEGYTLSPRASIGIAVGPSGQFDALLRDADAAMYQAKQRTSGARLHVIDRTRPEQDQGRRGSAV